VAFEGLSAEAGQPLRYRGTLQVGARDFVAEIQQDFGNAAHADATDAYKMNALDLGEHFSAADETSFPADFRGCTLIIKHFTVEPQRVRRRERQEAINQVQPGA
jgi:hypothetical protein